MNLERTDTPGLYRRNGRWVAVATFREGGRAKQRWITRDTKKAALDAKRTFLTDVDRGFRPAKATGTVSAFMEDWLKALEVAGRRPLTLRRYRSTIRNQIDPTVGDVALRDLDSDQVLGLLAGIPSRSSAAFTYTVLRAAMRHAVRTGVLVADPCLAVRRPRVERDEARHLSAEESLRMLEAVRGDRIESAVVLGLAGGLRVSEAIAVTWRDIDFATGVLTVSRSWWGRTKSGKTRSLYLPTSALATLRRYRAWQAEDLLRVGVRQTEDTCVVATALGDQMAEARFRGLFAAFCAEHGFDATFHTLRHSNAVALLSAGVDVKTVAGRLGHDAAVLLRTYAHFIPSADQAAAERLENVLGQTAAKN
ncbi:MAG: site-specific integrase [Actinomycetota bacterium]|nr:site-specific integrase [Actinomycetota bacterium]